MIKMISKIQNALIKVEISRLFDNYMFFIFFYNCMFKFNHQFNIILEMQFNYKKKLISRFCGRE